MPARIFLAVVRRRRYAGLMILAAVALTMASLGVGPKALAPLSWLLAGLPLWALLGAVEPALVVLVSAEAGLLWTVPIWWAFAAGIAVGGLVVWVRLLQWRGLDPTPYAATGSFAVLATAVSLPLGGMPALGPVASALILAPFGMDILLPNSNRSGAPRLLHLLGGLLVFLYMALAQIALLLVPVKHAQKLVGPAMRGLFRFFPYGKTERIGELGGPAIIVSNHQSSVDIPLALSLPGDVRLTPSQRVYGEPWLGFSARRLGHVVVDENLLENCRKTLAQGASVHLFPEGTRSKDGYPARFHRGAFELAAQLGCDVVPVVLCDTRTCVPRDAYWVERFHMVVRILPRQEPESDSRAMCKRVQALVRATFESELRRLNTPRVLRRKVKRLYRYMGWRVAAAVNRELNGLDLPQEPEADQVVLEDCGYGAAAHWLSECFPRLKITGHEPVQEKLAVARRSAAGKPRLRFEAP